MMTPVLKKILRSRHAKGFDTWTRYLSTLDEKERQLEIVSKRMLNGKLSAYLQAWASAVKMMKRQEVVLVKVISRLFKTQICVGFGNWLSNIRSTDRLEAELGLQRRYMKKILVKLSNGKTGAAWSAWISCVQYQMYLVNMFKPVLKKILRSRHTIG
jgi:hypothetical protein